MQNSKLSQSGEVDINQKLYIGCKLEQEFERLVLIKNQAFQIPPVRFKKNKTNQNQPNQPNRKKPHENPKTTLREKIHLILKGQCNICFYWCCDSS